jgi:hypothetical protein
MAALCIFKIDLFMMRVRATDVTEIRSRVQPANLCQTKASPHEVLPIDSLLGAEERG